MMNDHLKRNALITFSILLFIMIALIVMSIVKNTSESTSGFATEMNKIRIQSEHDDRKSVYIDGNRIFIELAVSNSEKSKGLSGRSHLEDNEGMLFVFENKTLPSFWMKDMLIPIDIVWIRDGKIISIDKNVSPPENGTEDNQLKVYKPPKGIDYVLEIKAGYSEENGIEVGDSVDMSEI